MARRREALAGIAAVVAAPWSGPASAADGVSDREVLLGQSAILSGVLGIPIRALLSGAQAAFDAVNAGGGIAGRQIRLISLDDELAPPKAVANYKKLLQTDRVFAMFACVGSGTTAAASEVLRATDAVAVGGYAVADSAREKAGDSAFFVRATTRREAESLVRQLTTIGIDRIAMAHLANPGGLEAFKLLEGAMAAYQIKPVASAGVEGDGSNLGNAARTLASANPQAVIMYLAGRLPADLMTAMRAAGSQPGFYGMSIVSGEVAAKVLGEKARGLAIAQVTPFPWRAISPEMQLYQRAVEQAKAGINYYTMEGWIDAQVVIEALRRCGKDLSRERFRTALKTMKTRVAGLDIDFTGAGNTGSRFVELVQVRADGTFIR